MVKHLFLGLAMACVALSATAAKPEVIAHRGYWKTDGSAQNSIRALVKADSIHCFASEFDVWMTADSVLVVNHDADVNGVHIETSSSKKVLAQKLANGENVPTLEAYLAKASKLNTRIVCELKTHDSRSMERAAAKAILALVKKYGLGDKVDYIVFSKDAFTYFVKHAPKGTGVYYLNGDYIPSQVKAMGGAGIDYSIKVMKKHPEWIAQCHDLGLLVNVWTVNAPEDMKWCIDRGVDFITTNEPELLQKMLKGCDGECKK
ncbi:MAG TPA: glycerophosphodiester phosphodiesterase family protein [Muribaculum sp.]|jgi:glycerophosphoryl diester phosphodiesterase|uniref:Glycerophosphodiester phosphodiesterase family protein n=1 Tax=Heminiphilus faecis TaxID=2601703 RepID=A0ABV4CWD7_9BACT|nr:glycerophosphodiester phosphodiesterase family protein [Heminiphilus faecis]HRF69585.1 glycerophosphodiester phosphodiesterase family protein [Muribaculum sp.]